MKKVIVSAIMLAAMTTTMYAKDVKTAAATVTAAADDNTKTKVDPAALPDNVKATLASETYKDYKVTDAYLVKANPDFYSIQVKKDDKVTTLNIDKDGKVKKD